MRIRALGWMVPLLLWSTLSPAAADEVAVLAGWHEPGRDFSTTEIGLEYRRPVGRYQLDWAIGAGGTADGAAWLYGGLRRAFAIGSGWEFVPGFAFELYDEGSDGKDLGGTFEFRSSGELSRRISDQTRIGVAIYHVSNAGFHDKNPGHNSLVFLVGRTLR